MNYRHDFHAGNAGDVCKHLTLVALLRLLTAKPKPLMVLDTHAGAGLYDLDSSEALRSPEHLSGIGRLWPGPSGVDLADHWLSLIAEANPPGRLRWYPGSPLLAMRLLRPGDRLVCVESEPPIARRLSAALERSGQAALTVTEGDGYERLVGLMPPSERRALILIDPPYEVADEWGLLCRHLPRALRRLPSAVVAVWIPVKTAAELAVRLEALADALPPEIRAEALAVGVRLPAPREEGRLAGSVTLLLNPPWRLEAALEPALSWVAGRLGPGARAGLGSLAAATGWF